jgi:hypothetical protein
MVGLTPCSAFGIVESPRWGGMHVCCFAIFEPMEQKLLNLE